MHARTVSSKLVIYSYTRFMHSDAINEAVFFLAQPVAAELGNFPEDNFIVPTNFRGLLKQSRTFVAAINSYLTVSFKCTRNKRGLNIEP